MSNLRLINFVFLDIRNSPQYFHSAAGQIRWDGHNWIGAGNLGEITNIGETIDKQPARVGVGVTGLPPEMVRVALDEHYQGRRAKIWLAMLENETDVLDPRLVFSGVIDTMQGQLGETASIRVQLENRMANWLRDNTRRYTKQDQAIDFPADRGLDFVAKVAQLEIIWGRTQR